MRSQMCFVAAVILPLVVRKSRSILVADFVVVQRVGQRVRLKVDSVVVGSGSDQRILPQKEMHLVSEAGPATDSRTLMLTLAYCQKLNLAVW